MYSEEWYALNGSAKQKKKAEHGWRERPKVHFS
jgi:hypothetical protein